MVNSQLTALFGLLISFVLMAFAAPVNSASYEHQPVVDKIRVYTDVQVKIRPTKIQLGQPVTFVIEGEDIAESVAKIDWSVFKKDFIVDSIDQGSSLFRAKLYPLKVGEFTLNAQRAGVVNIPQVMVQVEDNPNVSVIWQKPQETLFSQQQAAWQAEVKVNNPAFLVSIEKREKQSSEDVMVHLSKSSANALDQQADAARIVNASYEMPSVFKATELMIDSPIVTVKNTGNQLWKFFDQALAVKVEPLPNFLPMSVAVGQIQWQAERLDYGYQVGDLHYWQWQLTGHGMTLDYLKGATYQLLQQLNSSNDVSWLSESMQSSTDFDSNGMLNRLTVEIPYRIEQPGLVTFPELNLRYFDPLTGKVLQQKLAENMALSLPNWLVWILQWFMLVAVLVLLFVNLFVFKQIWYNRQFKRAMYQAETAEQLWQEMQNWQNHQAWYKQALNSQKTQAASSIGQWQEWYLAEFNKNAKVQAITSQLLEQLSIHLFAQQGTKKVTEDALRSLVVEWLKQQSIWPNLCQIKHYLKALWQRTSQLFN